MAVMRFDDSSATSDMASDSAGEVFVFPASFAQRRLWFLDRLEPGSPVYNIPQAVRLIGKVDAAALEQSLNTVVQRHETLRTTFALFEGQVVQAIAPERRLRLLRLDLGALPNDQNDMVRRLAAMHAARSFDLARGPLLSAALVKLNHREHILLLNIHHIIADGWSMHVLVREIAACYTAFAAGLRPDLPELAIQYADYADWQNQQLQGDVLDTHLAYWKQQLSHAPPLLDLPTDRPRPAVQSFDGAWQSFTLPADMAADLSALSQREGSTLFMTLLAAFQTLLARYTWQDAIVVGTPIANRTRAELEPLIGFFVNTLVLCTDLSGDPSFCEALRRVHAVTMGAYAHQDLPFEQLVSEIQPQRDMSYTPLFQVMFALQNTPVTTIELPDLLLTPLPTDTGTAKFDITLAFEETPHGLAGSVEYRTDLFDATTITWLANHLRTLLAAIISDPQQTIGRLSIISPTEREQLLSLANPHESAELPERAVHELVAAQAARAPDAVAVVFSGKSDVRPTAERTQLSLALHLTYAELDRRANQVAAYLRALGVRPEVAVGICIERSLDLVIAVLGILKAGGAFVPLDSASPPERLAFMLHDAQIDILLTQSRLRDRFAGLQRLIALDADWASIAQASTETSGSVTHPLSLAYIIYTSGSTGLPKGALILQRGLLNLVSWHLRAFGVAASDRATLVAGVAFDASVWELWPYLVAGASVHIPDDDTRATPEELRDWMLAHAISISFAPTPLAEQLLMLEWAPRTRLRAMLTGGDKLHHYPSPQLPFALINNYGPTENTVVATSGLIPPLDGATAPPIGRALPNTQLYVLDRNLDLSPLGVRGELVIGGVQLARGYLDRPDLTADRFIPNPFTSVGSMQYAVCSMPMSVERRLPTADCRLYRTGDFARYLPNGEIEYLGRIDQQVKIRGYRIELGEIEAALAQHPDVCDAVVLARGDRHDNKRLVAYIVPTTEVRSESAQGTGGSVPPIGDERRTANDERTITEDGRLKTEDSDVGASAPLSSSRYHRSADLRAFLAERLPAYMIPVAFVALPALPLTPNGKIDHRALPAPASIRSRAFAPPQTAAEELLAQVWSDVLGLAQIGIHDNFFELGGDSIRSIQIVTEARKRELFFTVRQLFQNQTIQALGQSLASATNPPPAIATSQPFSLIAAIDRQQLPHQVEDAYPLTSLQMGMLFHSAYDQGSAVYHTLTTIHIQAAFDFEKLCAAIQQLAVRHPALRTSFELSLFSEPLQLVHQMVQIPVELTDLSAYAPEAQTAALSAWFEAEKRRPFVWAKPPLLRCHIHRRSADTFQLSWSAHHAILDGWSVATMLAELCQHYLLLIGETDQPLAPPPAVSFREFVALERQAITGLACQEYWAAKLQGIALTQIPRWSLTPETARELLLVQAVPISEATSEELNRLAQAAGAPLKSVLLAVHLRVLQFVSGQTDIVTGVVTNGRPEQQDGERTLGLFLNTLPLRLSLRGGSWLDLIRTTFAAEQELLEYRRYPLAEIQRLFGGQALFETMFNFVHFHIYGVALGAKGLKILHERHFLETNFTLVANFNRDPSSSLIYLALDSKSLCAEQLARIGTYYARAFSALLADPRSRYDAADLLTPSERHELLVGWNATSALYPHDRCIHELFEAQAAQTPEAIALVYEDQHVCYQELNRRANQLAHHLRALRVGPDVRVALCMERSPALVIGLLGILKAGGAYVPIDPAYPRERIRFMLEDSEAHIVMGDGRWTMDDLEKTQASIAHRTSKSVHLSADWPIIATQPPTSPQSRVTSDNLAYMIYTSGSTGQPKGALIPHRSLVNHMAWMRTTFPLDARDAILQKTPCSFDASVWEFFAPLLDGARLTLADPGGHQDPAYLVATLRAQQITVLQLVPTLLALLVQDPGFARCTSLRRVFCGGEALDGALVAQFSARVPSPALYNLYGPSEATIDATWWPCAQGQSGAAVPIGRPIANVHSYILDPALRLVPLGAPGELYIGGVGVGRGYHQRPDLTAARFIPNPFGTLNDEDRPMNTPPSVFRVPRSAFGARLYRTGDRARYRPDGAIEFLGRVDHQVKLRGFRIELGEIESRLKSHPQVQTAAVIVREDQPGDQRLVAYLVPQGATNQRAVGAGRLGESRGEQQADTSIDERRARASEPATSRLSADLRDFLRQTLPNHMLPSTFVELDALALTPNGKVDRTALPMPDLPSRERTLAPPRDMLEFQLTEIWEMIFNIHPLGVEDNFFELGGHSLLAVRMMAQVHEKLGYQAPLSTLFQHTTIARLATALREQAQVRSQSPLVGIQTAGSQPPFVCVHPAGGNVLCYTALARHLGYDQPVYGLESPGLHDEPQPYTRLEDLAARYIEAIRSLQPHGPYYIGGWSLGGVIAFEIAQQLRRKGESIALLAILDSLAPKAHGNGHREDSAEEIVNLAHQLGQLHKRELSISYDDLWRHEPNAQLDYLLEAAQRAGIVISQSAAAQMRHLARIRAGNVQCIENYTPQSYPGRITLFRASEMLSEGFIDAAWDWSPYSTEPIAIYSVPGNHETMIAEPHVRVLAAQLAACIAKDYS